MKRNLIVALTGASGQVYGIRLLQAVREMPLVETHLVLSEQARRIIPQETDYRPEEVEELADVVYPVADVGAPIASGSFPASGMVVAPCSIKTLSAIAHSYGADLVARAADVQLKEGRPLLLLVRETPLHLGHLRLMVRVAEMGGVLMPPIPAFYTRPQSLTDLVDQTIGRVLARMGIENDLYPVWQGG